MYTHLIWIGIQPWQLCHLSFIAIRYIQILPDSRIPIWNIHEKIPKDFVPRSEYTSQIMDILNNVAKQKNETKKVIEEIRTLQKDINMQEGKLGRTYADADYLLFEVSFIKEKS